MITLNFTTFPSRTIFLFLLAPFLTLTASLREGYFPQIAPAAHRILDEGAAYFHSFLEFLEEFPFQNYSTSKDYHGQGAFFLDMWNEGQYKEDVIKGILEIGGIWEEFMLEYIRYYARPGSSVIDVGAHIGTHTMVMSRSVGPSGTVYAFEPQPKIVRELFMNLLLNQAENVKVFPIALGAKEGQIELRPLTPKNEGGTCLGGDPSTGQFVPLKTLDSFHLQNVSLIKADLEGMEQAFLEGAKETIALNRPIILIEIGGGECYETTTETVRSQMRKIFDTLTNYRYRVERAKGPWAACWDYVAFPMEGS